MDNIQPLITAKPVQVDGVKITAKPPQENAVKIETSQKAMVARVELNQLAPFKEAAELRAETHLAREEATKNIETIRERLTEISASLNEDMDIRSKNLSFSIDKDTDRMVVTVTDKESGKVIKKIPSEAVLKVAHSMTTLKGILYDDK